LAWAEQDGAWVIEDDYDAEFRYDREPVRALQGLAPHRVVQLGTVSKTLAPALRLGWMVVPFEFLDDVLAQKALADEFSPAVDQLTLAAFLQSGEYDRQVRKARSIYRARRDLLVHELSVELPEFRVTGIAAGLHVLLELPPWSDDAAIARCALEDEIRVSALSNFCLERTDAKGLVVGYGRLHESAIGRAVPRLAAVVRRHLTSGSRPRMKALLP
jgi:GntR family transcriptional regulator/MocR family aminotransferase